MDGKVSLGANETMRTTEKNTQANKLAKTIIVEGNNNDNDNDITQWFREQQHHHHTNTAIYTYICSLGVHVSAPISNLLMTEDMKKYKYNMRLQDEFRNERNEPERKSTEWMSERTWGKRKNNRKKQRNSMREKPSRMNGKRRKNEQKKLRKKTILQTYVEKFNLHKYEKTDRNGMKSFGAHSDIWISLQFFTGWCCCCCCCYCSLCCRGRYRTKITTHV